MKAGLFVFIGMGLVLLMLTANVSAQVPDTREAGWMADPLEDGAMWWRDSVNQNDIANYYYSTYPQVPRVVNITDNIYVVKGVGLANVVALVGDTDWTLIDTGEAPTSLQLDLALLRPYTSTKPLRNIIYTGEDTNHVSGSSITVSLRPTIISSDQLLPTLVNRSSDPNYFIYQILSSGLMLTEGPDGRVGPLIFGKYPFLYPNQLISSDTTANLSGFNAELLMKNGYSSAGLIVWLPDQKIAVVGDAWGPTLPVIGPIVKPGRHADAWADTVDSIIQLNPDYVIPVQGPVLTPADDIDGILADYSDALRYIYDETTQLMDDGVSEEDAAAQVHLPQALADNLYLQPYAMDVHSAVRGLYHPDDVWYKGEPVELASTLDSIVRAQAESELSGDLRHMLETSKQAELDAEDIASAEEALYMSWITYSDYPGNLLANRIYVQTLRKNAYMQRSNQIRNIYLTSANLVEVYMPVDVCGNGAYESGEECDGSAFCLENCTCSEGYMPDTQNPGDCVPLCTVTGADDNCDGVDDDCDGTADNHYVSTATSCGVGVCASTGIIACVNGQETDSCIAGNPTGADDDCDALDQDCDGTADNHYAGQQTSCGVGACGATGVTTCVGGQEIDSCVPGTPSAEICNGVDDDCNSQVDEGLTAPLADNQNGVCQGDTKVCSGTSGWVEPDITQNPSYLPYDLPGNSVDEDCDGTMTCDAQESWKNHGGYVSCVSNACKTLLNQGLISDDEKEEITSEAAKSDVGKPKGKGKK